MPFSRCLLTIAVLLCLAPTAGAAPQLVGQPEAGPPRLLDRDARPLAGRPPLRVPGRATHTRLSPNGKRFLVASHTDNFFRGPGHMTIFERRSGERLRSVRLRKAERVLAWPTRRPVLTVLNRDATAAGGDVPSRIRAYDARTGRAVASTAVPHTLLEAEDGSGLFALEGGDLALLRPRPDGSVRTIDVPLESGAARDTYVSLAGGLLLVNPRGGTRIFRIEDGAASPLPTDLPNDFFTWMAPGLLAGGAFAVRVDPRTGTIEQTVDVDQRLQSAFRESITPFKDGFVVGLGRLIYDADLELVEENPTRGAYGGDVHVLGNRLFAPRQDCDSLKRSYVVVDARTGKTVREPKRLREVGRLGGPLQQVVRDCSLD